VATCGSWIFLGLAQPQAPIVRPGKVKPGGSTTGKLQTAIIHAAEPNKLPEAVKLRAAVVFPRESLRESSGSGIGNPIRFSVYGWKCVCS
jgi:hypothetical protein